MISPRVVEIFAEKFAGIINEGLALLVHDRLHHAGLRVHGKHAQRLMPALVEQKSEPRGIRVPAHVVNAPRIFEQIVADGDFLFAGDVEQVRARHGNFVAGRALRNSPS